MGFEARILADSVAPCGKRLTTYLWRYPRPIHAEIMTNRAWSKNSASSRAIPPLKLVEMLESDPWIPDYIGKSQKGMQAGEELTENERAEAVRVWIEARDNAIKSAKYLLSLGVHKSLINRLLEPWMWITVIASATEQPNMYGLRLHKDAERHYQHLMRMSKAALDASTPRKLEVGMWHVPLIYEEDYSLITDYVANKIGQYGLVEAGLLGRVPDDTAKLAQEVLIKVSVGRCARVSYLTHDGRRDIAEDVALHDRLVVQRPLHASPAEHVAQALDTLEWSGNFCGFRQYRKTLPHENITTWEEVAQLASVI
jgi:hypothetical protein